MAFIKLQRDVFENTAVTLRPRIHFISSSAGVTGSEYVAPVRSKCIKDLTFDSELFDRMEELVPSEVDFYNTNSQFDESDVGFIHFYEFEIKNKLLFGGLDEFLDRYMQAVNEKPPERRFSKLIDIHRIDPSFQFNPPGGLNQTIKSNIRNILMPYYKHKYRDCGYHYRNYNTINFFTASNLPESAVLMYPDENDEYVPDSSFATSLWINPRNKVLSGTNFNAGTILHISSSLCISLISGSSQDIEQNVDSFKILVQLSQSADIPPSNINFSNLTYPSDLIFTSSNELKWNNWHSVTFNWGANLYNDFTASLYIDEKETVFAIPSSSLGTHTRNPLGNSAIFVGNYYDGSDVNINKFFNATSATKEGLQQLDPGNDDPNPSTYNFNHPLNAEFHELKVFNRHLTGSEITTRNKVSEWYKDDLSFYLPPYFYPETTTREVLQTPFQKFTTGTNDPFNVAFSFGVGGKEINIENFLNDYKKDIQPRMFHMTSSDMTGAVLNMTADEYVYASGSILKRNFLLLPNDNGQFFPNFKLLEDRATLNDLTSSFVTTNEGVDFGIISLEDLIPTASLFPGLIAEGELNSNSPLSQVMGASPENPGVIPGSVLTIAQRTRDMSSNEIVMVNISNLYYGNRIIPGTVELIESNLTGSAGKIKMCIKDDGFGSLYRADCLTEQATWASLGNVFYDEGVAIVKTPHVPYFMKSRAEIKFVGEHNIHTYTINVPVEKSILNSSSNKSFKTLPPSTNVNDRDVESIMLSNVNIHDENFNIIMRANFAQPITKTEYDEFVVRLKEDF